MNYKETLKYLFAQLPMYQREGKSAFKKDLTNIIALCNHLSDPHLSYPTIHIAGTNGKGTTAHMIAAILQFSGMKVGLYTSPHYVDFRERIKINGTYVSEEFVIDFVNQIRNELGTINPSFFEFSVAMAFQYFKDKDVDVAVIETGLGGRLDSTNVVLPLLSVITNISLDHQNMLGDKKYAIAKEKAGIIKKDVPVVIGKYQPSADQVFIQKAKELNCPISFASLKWESEECGDHLHFHSPHHDLAYRIPLKERSPFIAENIITALETVQLLIANEMKISNEDIVDGIRNFRSYSRYLGRWHTVREKPLIIADSAHNIEALQRLLVFLKNMNFDNIHFILGFLKDKDVDILLSLFDPKYSYYFVKPDVVRGLNVDDLYKKGKAQNISGTAFPTVQEALNAAQRMAGENDLIYVGGSSFVVADALKLEGFGNTDF